MLNIKYCVISLIFNNYEILREIDEKSENCDYFLFTDNPNLQSSTWNVIYLKEFDKDDISGIQKTYMFKYSFYKYIPNIKQYDYFIRLDHSIKILKPIDCIINYLRNYKYDLMCTIHQLRTNFEDEYMTWHYARGLDLKYKDKFFEYRPVDNIGLVECTVMAYKNCKEIFNLLDNVYLTLKTYNNFEDANDQCYFTCELYAMLDKLRILYTNDHLYRNTPLNSGLLNLHWHNLNELVPDNNENIQTKIFGKEQIVKIFKYE